MRLIKPLGWCVLTGTAFSASSILQADEIVFSTLTVTADKVEQNILETPRHVSVRTAAELQEQGVSSLAQLEGRLSALSFQPFGQSGINSPVLRGLTANFNALSSSTLLVIDGVPILTAQGFESTLVGIDRIEIARGPQSALYGKNAEAGVINVFSNDLNGDDGTELSLELGSRHKRVGQFELNQTLVENEIYSSLSGEWLEQDGFIDNTNTGHEADDKERINLNGGLRWLASPDTDIEVRYRQQTYDDGAMLWGSPSSQRASVASGTDSWNKSSGQVFSIKGEHQLNSDTKLNFVTAYNAYHDHIQQDTDFQPTETLYVGRDHRLRTLSQEVRFDGELGDTRWLLGAYADYQDHDLRTYSKTYFGLSDLQAEETGNAYALFTNWDVSLSDKVTVSAGMRASYDEIHLTPQGAQKRSKSWSDLTPQTSLKFAISPNHLLYLSYAEGLRAGGFNTTSSAVNYASFEPETNQSIEVGFKGTSSNTDLEYGVSLYHMTIEDMQVMQMPSVGVIYLTNAAEGTSEGAEFNLGYHVTRELSLQTGVAWNKTRFDHFIDGSNDYSGNHNPFAPEVNGHISVNYQNVEGWFVAASLVFNGEVYLDASNQYKQAAYEVLNVSSGMPINDDVFLSAYVNNVTDEEFDAVGYQNGFVTVYSPPRELGVKLNWSL